MAGWTPVNEDALKQTADASAWKPVEESAKEQPGVLKRAWDWLNKPAADNLLPKGISTSDIFKAAAFHSLTGEQYVPGINDFDTKQKEHFGESPTKDALKTFISGATKDTADLAASQTSPMGLGLLAGGALTKAPGAVGALAKVVTGTASAGFSGKGATDIANAGFENTPEAWQKRLIGGAMLTGGMAGVGSATKGIVPKSVPAAMYESALKARTTIPVAVREGMVDAALRNEIPISKGGLEKLGALIDDTNAKIKNLIDTGSNQGATVNKFAVASRLGNTVSKFSNQVNPNADLNAIGESGNEFLENQPNEIPASQAQSLKQGTYQQLKSRAYGELKSATVESQKALARGIKEELVSQFPELKDLNAEDSKLINLEGVLETAVNRIGNHQLVGIGTPIAAGATKAITGSTVLGAIAGTLKGVVDNPIVKSKIAIALARQGVPAGKIATRLGSYSAALGNAATSIPGEDQKGEQ